MAMSVISSSMLDDGRHAGVFPESAGKKPGNKRLVSKGLPSEGTGY